MTHEAKKIPRCMHWRLTRDTEILHGLFIVIKGGSEIFVHKLIVDTAHYSRQINWYRLCPIPLQFSSQTFRFAVS